VRTDAGDEVAHYAAREAAELVAQQIAQERRSIWSFVFLTGEPLARASRKDGYPSYSGDNRWERRGLTRSRLRHALGSMPRAGARS
jgi:hypothetical protein